MISSITKKLEAMSIRSIRLDLILWLSLTSVFIIPANDQVKNFSIQEYFIFISGLFAWVCLFTYDLKLLKKITNNYALLALLLGCLITMVFAHTGLDLWGSYFYPIGILTILSFVGIALITSQLSLNKVLNAIFITVTLAAVISLPYDLINYGSFYKGRLSGILFQPDVLAAYLGCGFIVGLQLFKTTFSQKKRLIVSICEAFLIACIYFTQTRAVFIIVALLTIFFLVLIRTNRGVILKGLIIPFVVVLLLFIAGSSRLLNAHDLQTSTSYRFSLQQKIFPDMSRVYVHGVSNKGLANDLDCSKLQSAAALKQTCFEGYIFDSSHNIFLDRFLQIGVVGGIGYLFLIVRSIFRRLALKNSVELSASLMTLLIASYYLTNITSASLELLLWLVILNTKKQKV